mgnify:CR=1 FL=1
MLLTGIDIIEIDRIQNVLSRYGNRFLNKIFTPDEIQYCRGRSPNLAGRFAAKEAFVKALGTGFRNNINFKDIEVAKNLHGKPYIIMKEKISNKIKTLFKVKKFNVSLSISDEKKYSIANVIISK